MGKGGYRGGGSVLTPNGWFIGSQKALPGRDKTVMTLHEEPTKEDFVEPPRRRVPSRPRKVQLSEKDVRKLELAYLERIIDAQLSGSNYPGMPNLIRPILEPAIREAGDLITWAKQHADTAAIVNRKLATARAVVQKVPRKVEVLDVFNVGDARRLAVVGDEENAARLAALKAERERLDTALDEALEVTKKLRDRLAIIDQEMTIRAGRSQ